MYGAIVGLVLLSGVGQVPAGWWKLTRSTEFRWDSVPGRSNREVRRRLLKAAVLARTDACGLAARELKAAEKVLGGRTDETWLEVGRVYYHCMRWMDMYRAVRKSGLSLSSLPVWAKIGAATALVAEGRPWEAFRIYENLSSKAGTGPYGYRLLGALAALEAGQPGKALSMLASQAAAHSSIGSSQTRIWQWLVRGLALLVDGRSAQARKLFRAVILSDPDLESFRLARNVLVGCFDFPLVAGLLEQAVGCDQSARLRARAASYRRNGHTGGRSGGLGARGLRAGTGSSRSAPTRSRRAHCAGFVPALEAAAAWKPASRTVGRCGLLDDRFRRWVQSAGDEEGRDAVVGRSPARSHR